MARSNIPISKTNLINEWDFDQNKKIGLNPDIVTTGSTQKAFWKCPKCGYCWKATIQMRFKKNTGCRVCKSHKILPGYNDLLTKNPQLVLEWDYEKNNKIGLYPNKVGPGTIRKAWWKCPNGHPSYFASISSRAARGSGCAVCANKRVLPGYNDLATTRPDMLLQWNYDKNNALGITPNSVTAVSGKKVWWKCKRGHEWKTAISHIAYGRGCPYCNSGRSTSFPEQAIYYFLKNYDSGCVNRYRLGGYEMDVFIPSKRIGIEYNGYRWHKGPEKEMRDHIKQVYFEEHGIRLLKIIEIEKKVQHFGNFSVENEDLYYINDNDDEGLAGTIEELVFDIFGKRIFVDIDFYRSKIYESYDLNEKKWSFANDDGGCLFEWDYEKNGELKPEYISRRSGKVVYWKCKKGHSFRKSPHEIYLLKTCPECTKEYVYNNRFELSHPELLDEWDYEKNVGISTDEITCGSTRKIWWKCNKGHTSWQAPIVSRINGHGCPKCGHQKIREKKYKRVAQYDLKGNFIREWDGAALAQETLGILHVSSVCNGHRKTAGGFKWRYIESKKRDYQAN